MKLVIKNYQIEKVLDNNNNQIEPESLMGTSYWNIYNVIDALLYHHVKRYDADKNTYYAYYAYRKRFETLYQSSSFYIDIDADFCIFKSIKGI